MMVDSMASASNTLGLHGINTISQDFAIFTSDVSVDPWVSMTIKVAPFCSAAYIVS